ncbi:basic proline-rich protein-like [Sarcophilus harrisii]|uniref:basic proline-rich protein-like n=1 Tax=Sarcophilus harrisii TaxID=9305 RepID=UPI001301C87B|nr:basic proline-rich protein-like [Sarcophilus harrisii]
MFPPAPPGRAAGGPAASGPPPRAARAPPGEARLRAPRRPGEAALPGPAGPSWGFRGSLPRGDGIPQGPGESLLGLSGIFCPGETAPPRSPGQPLLGLPGLLPRGRISPRDPGGPSWGFRVFVPGDALPRGPGVPPGLRAPPRGAASPGPRCPSWDFRDSCPGGGSIPRGPPRKSLLGLRDLLSRGSCHPPGPRCPSGTSGAPAPGRLQHLPPPQEPRRVPPGAIRELLPRGDCSIPPGPGESLSGLSGRVLPRGRALPTPTKGPGAPPRGKGGLVPGESTSPPRAHEPPGLWALSPGKQQHLPIPIGRPGEVRDAPGKELHLPSRLPSEPSVGERRDTPAPGRGRRAPVNPPPRDTRDTFPPLIHPLPKPFPVPYTGESGAPLLQPKAASDPLPLTPPYSRDRGASSSAPADRSPAPTLPPAAPNPPPTPWAPGLSSRNRARSEAPRLN